MNIIKKAIDEIRFEIPKQILTAAFVDPVMARRGIPVSLDTIIRQEVIENRVMTDCNLVGGLTVVIPLDQADVEYIDQSSMIYRIPKSLTQGRSITTALEVSIGDYSTMWVNATGISSASQLANAGQGMLTANQPIQSPSSAYVTLIGENVVYLTECYVRSSNLYLRCIIENDSSFSNLPVSAYHDFAMLCKYATKAFIFNKLALELDIGGIFAGMALGRIKDIVDGYADANELYGTFLKDTWRKVALLSDPMAKQRHLKQISGRGY